MLITATEIKIKDGTKIILKSPDVDDAELLLEHLRIVFHEAHRNMNHPPDYFDKFAVDDEKKILAEFAEAKNKFMISAFYENKIIGNIGCFGSVGEYLKHSARIGMDVDKSFRGKGLGEALLKAAISNAKALKFKRLELTVRSFNTAGINLYEKIGFQFVGILKDVAFIENEYHDERLYQMILL